MLPVSDPASIPTVEDCHSRGFASAALPDDPGAEMADFFAWNRLPTDEEIEAMFAEDERHNAA